MGGVHGRRFWWANDLADLCSMEIFGDEPTLGGGRVLPRWVSYIPTDRRLRFGGLAFLNAWHS